MRMGDVSVMPHACLLVVVLYTRACYLMQCYEYTPDTLLSSALL